MKIVVSGAGGFIGSHLVEASVRSGHDVRAVVNYNSRGDYGHLRDIDPAVGSAIEIQAFDIRDHEAVDRCCVGADAIFHLAALIGIPYSYRTPATFVDVNVNGTLNFLNAGRRFGVGHVVHTSTSEVYGSAQYVPIDERHPLVGQSPYSASKIGADKLAESYALSFEMPITIIRPFNTFGPRQSMRAVIPTMASQLLDNESDCVRVGSLDPVRDFTYVTDTAAAYLETLTHATPRGGVINLGTGVAFSVREIYEKLQAVTGISKRIVCEEVRIRPEKSEVLRLISDNALAREMLGWQPKVSFEQGLAHVIDYLRAHRPDRASSYHI